MRITMRKIGYALAVVTLLSSAAAAFQVQEKSMSPGQSSSSVAPAVPGPQLSSPSSDKPELRLDMPESIGGSSSGTEIRIPGLGKLGIIPKMDFGLELLYGANQKERSAPEVNANESPDGEFAIRGSIRHRF